VTEHYTFPDTVAGLEAAFERTLTLRHFGFKTRLATRVFGHTTVQTVVATPPKRPNRKDRGCYL